MYPKPVAQPQIVKRLFNNKEKKCVLVEVEGEEYVACDYASRNFWGSSKKGTYGKGLLNSENDPRKTERIGLLGQMAFSKLIDEPVDLAYRHGGDKQDNLIFGKYKIDIKCAARNYGANLIQKTNEFGKEQKIDKHIYIGSFLDSENREEKKAEILLVGFCLRKDVLGAKVAPARKGNHINYEIPFEEMRPIINLITTIKDYKAINLSIINLQSVVDRELTHIIVSTSLATSLHSSPECPLIS